MRHRSSIFAAVGNVVTKFWKSAMQREFENAAPRDSSASDEREAEPAMSVRSFQIIEATPPHEPIERPEQPVEIDKDFTSTMEASTQSAYRLYIDAQAQATIREHIAWGHRTPFNRVEQGGILLGKAFRDSTTRIVYGVATQAVPAHRAVGSPAYVAFHHDAWFHMLQEADRLAEIAGNNLHVIGWYHTHPGELSVFMSGTDRASQRRMFYADWHFAIVLNPQRRIWRAFHGANSEECAGFGVRTFLLD